MDRTEGDVNGSEARSAWQDSNVDEPTRALLGTDARGFLRQSLSTPCLNALRGASGAWIEDLGGRRFLDFHGNSVHQVGYGHPRVVEAVRAQLNELPFCPRRYANRPAAELAQRLGQLAPGDLSKCLFAPAGSLAVGIALKLARAATGRHKTIAFCNSFHGASLDAAGVGGEGLFHARMGPLMPGAMHVPPPDRTGCAACGGSTCTAGCAAEIETILEREGDIAAVIAEPIRATTVTTAPVEFWQSVRRACTSHGTLLIFDEIPTALGRTGRLFASEHCRVVPDILVLGKGLGGGVMPLAATIASPALDIAPELALGHFTHEKSPLASAAALATLGVLEEEDLVERSRALGVTVLKQLRDRLTDCPTVSACRGVGLMIGVEHAAHRGRTAEEIAEAVMYRALTSGLSYKVGGGRVATLFPPLNIAEHDLDQAVDWFVGACIAEAG